MTMNAYAFEERTACYVFGDFKMPQTWTRAHRQCANRKGAGSLDPPPPLENNEFYRFVEKMQFGTITLEKVGPPEICDPPFLDSSKIIVSLK